MTRRIAMVSVHACPLAKLGGRDSGGMNVYVRELARDLGARGVEVDVFTRWREKDDPRDDREPQPTKTENVILCVLAKDPASNVHGQILREYTQNDRLSTECFRSGGNGLV